MKEYLYFWYYGGMTSAERESVTDSINDRDYDMFMHYYTNPNFKNNLPNYISVYENNKRVGQLDIADRDNFNLITYNECEHG